ncbi:unnamed protein product [Cyprideis torosa]|uniref:Uncharacterized protein n=1 Tax=Cyprideis torosa TaxID=163714 RepID=A0A7R8ZMR2_9CRUS|nr:unnamed protein product [Cyprideis torosa]CAG0889622.1 unnamed protein product [Cyprideis torosa]
MQPSEVVFVPESIDDITPQWLQECVLKEQIEGEFEVVNLKRTCATDSQDRQGYTSLMIRIEVDVEIKTTEEKKKINLFAKLYPPNEQHRKMVREIMVFDREIFVYTSLLNSIRSAQESSKVQLEPFWPKCVFTAMNRDARVSAVIMEDLKARGFILMDKTKGLDFEHLNLGCKAFARTHALTFHLKQTVGVEQFLINNYQLLQEPLDIFKHIFDINFDISIGFLKGSGRPDLAKRMEDFREKQKEPLGVHLRSILSRPHRMRTLIQGDCWVNNMMFRHELQDGKEVPVEIKLLDLQCVRYGHPCEDLTYFLFTSSYSYQRNPFTEQLLRNYYETFFNSLFELGSSFTRSQYTFDELKADYNSFREMGLILGAFFVIAQMADPKDVPNLDTAEGDVIEVFRKFIEDLGTRPVPGPIAKRTQDLAEDAVAHGVI